MEKDSKVFIKSVRILLLMLMLLTLFTGATAFGATIDVYLQVGVQTIPVNAFNNPEAITMWGYAQCTDATFTSCGAVTVPGPTLSAQQGDTLRIHVNNTLTGPFTEPTSVIIPGQSATMTPVWIDPVTGAVVSTGSRLPGDVTSRMRSFATETAVGGPPTTYIWPSLKAGSYLYQSGTHPALQVQMGLYGALIVRTAGGAPYPGITAPNNEATLLFSEIDPELHYSVASGLYGTPPPPPPAVPVRGQRTSAEDYHPQYFLINGAPYSPALSPIPAGNPGQSLLIRFLNAGLLEKTPTLQNQYMTIIAEDGNLLPYSKQQYSLLLPAGKTMDAIISPATAGYISVFDRSLNLTSGATSPGGMLVYLSVGAANQLLTVTLAGTGTGRVIATSLPGGIDCGLDCSENYVIGTVVTLTAIPDPGVSFGGWTGVDPGTETLNPATVTMNAPKNVTATFGAGTPAGGAITVTSPNGGETWTAGSTQTISWTYTGNPGTYVKIELLKGGVVNRTIAALVSKGSGGAGSRMWTIPVTQTAGNDYTIRITSTSNGANTDTSNSPFTINLPTIIVTSPNGGETWTAGSTQTISWTYTGNPGTYVKIELLKGGVVNRTIAALVTKGSGGAGSRTWAIPPTQTPGNDYTIRITSTSNGAVTDTSNGPFTINPPSIKVSSPNGGEIWTAGSTQTISWTYTGNPGTYVKIELLKGGVVNRTIAALVTKGNGGGGSRTWAIPPTQTPGNDYTIRITSTSNSGFTDVSDGNFTIQ